MHVILNDFLNFTNFFSLISRFISFCVRHLHLDYNLIVCFYCVVCIYTESIVVGKLLNWWKEYLPEFVLSITDYFRFALIYLTLCLHQQSFEVWIIYPNVQWSKGTVYLFSYFMLNSIHLTIHLLIQNITDSCCKSRYLHILYIYMQCYGSCHLRTLALQAQ